MAGMGAGIPIFCINPVVDATVNTASAAADIGRYLAEKLRNLTRDQEERAIDFMKSIKFDYYDETSICKSISGIGMNEYEEFVRSFGRRHQFPVDITGAIVEARYGTENQEVFKNFRFVVGATNIAVYLDIVTRRRSGPDGGMDFACVMIKFEFRLSRVEVTSGLACGILKMFGFSNDIIRSLGQGIGAMELRERDLTLDQQDCIINYFRSQAKNALMLGTENE